MGVRLLLEGGARVPHRWLWSVDAGVAGVA